jgi:hypothetical protein
LSDFVVRIWRAFLSVSVLQRSERTEQSHGYLHAGMENQL